jgi:hypothetical protein
MALWLLQMLFLGSLGSTVKFSSHVEGDLVFCNPHSTAAQRAGSTGVTFPSPGTETLFWIEFWSVSRRATLSLLCLSLFSLTRFSHVVTRSDKEMSALFRLARLQPRCPIRLTVQAQPCESLMRRKLHDPWLHPSISRFWLAGWPQPYLSPPAPVLAGVKSTIHQKHSDG